MSRERHEMLVTVATFATGLDASVARGALEAEGIRAYVPVIAAATSRHAARLRPITEVRVRTSDRRRAMEVLERAGSR
jgi:hypothetical protein